MSSAGQPKRELVLFKGVCGFAHNTCWKLCIQTCGEGPAWQLPPRDPLVVVLKLQGNDVSQGQHKAVADGGGAVTGGL